MGPQDNPLEVEQQQRKEYEARHAELEATTTARDQKLHDFGSIQSMVSRAKQALRDTTGAAIRTGMSTPDSVTDSAQSIAILRETVNTAKAVLIHFEVGPLADAEEAVIVATVAELRALRNAEQARLTAYQFQIGSLLARAAEVEGGAVEIVASGGRGDALQKLVADASRALETAESNLTAHRQRTAERRAELAEKENIL